MADQSNEMVSRVARAILKARFYDIEPDMYDHDIEWFHESVYPEHKDDAEAEARAAIEAMRELSPGVFRIMREDIEAISDGWFPSDGVKAVWENAIDAALSHDEVKG